MRRLSVAITSGGRVAIAKCWFCQRFVETLIGAVWGRHQRDKRSLEMVEGLLTTSPSDGRDPRLEWLYHQIAQLKDVDRSVALLLLDGFSYKEIAAIVGLTETNVGVKINRIKLALAGKRMEETTL